ncbi:hypothetical protein D3C86_1402570 [compost metagenome]
MVRGTPTAVRNLHHLLLAADEEDPPCSEGEGDRLRETGPIIRAQPLARDLVDPGVIAVHEIEVVGGVSRHPHELGPAGDGQVVGIQHGTAHAQVHHLVPGGDEKGARGDGDAAGLIEPRSDHAQRLGCLGVLVDLPAAGGGDVEVPCRVLCDAEGILDPGGQGREAAAVPLHEGALHARVEGLVDIVDVPCAVPDHSAGKVDGVVSEGALDRAVRIELVDRVRVVS